MLRRSISFLPLFKAEFLLGYQRLAYGLRKLIDRCNVCYSDLLTGKLLYVYNFFKAIPIPEQLLEQEDLQKAFFINNHAATISFGLSMQQECLISIQ